MAVELGIVCCENSVGVVIGSIADHLNGTDGNQIPEVKATVIALIVNESLLTILSIDTSFLVISVEPRIQSCTGDGEVGDSLNHDRPGEVAREIVADACACIIGKDGLVVEVVVVELTRNIEGTWRFGCNRILEVWRFCLNHARKCVCGLGEVILIEISALPFDFLFTVTQKATKHLLSQHNAEESLLKDNKTWRLSDSPLKLGAFKTQGILKQTDLV